MMKPATGRARDRAARFSRPAAEPGTGGAAGEPALRSVAPAPPPSPSPGVVELSGPAPTARTGAAAAPGGAGRWLRLSFALCVVLPALAGAVYFGHVASDRYSAGAGFAVRGVTASTAGLDGITALTGLAAAGSTTSDSYIVLNYLRSRELVARLEESIDFTAAFADPAIDPLSRMGAGLSVEDRVAYWDRRLFTTFDSNSGIVTFEVQAFSPETARDLAALALRQTQELVNRLSESARRDAVRFAKAEVARAEARLRTAQLALRRFRAEEQLIDPVAAAQLDVELLARLDARLTDLRARITGLAGRVSDDAPTLTRLQAEAAALEDQMAARTERIARTRAETGGAGGAATSALLADYEALEVEREFAQQAYASALTSLEQARIEADRQQRYLAVYAAPVTPEEALYPRRALSAGMVTVVAFTLWGIGALLVGAVRDHLA